MAGHDGHIVHFQTGYVSPGAAVYCPFLTFERARGSKEDRLESANNQCAIGGSWCVRALQKLFNVAYAGGVGPEMLVSFSCTIDNDFAIINHHWIGDGEEYCMASLCKFDLTKEEHFSKFVLWIEVIGEWGINTLLPKIKSALGKIRRSRSQVSTPSLSLTTSADSSKEEVLIKALKTTFDTIPWRLEDDDFTPVSSSTASWGSPTVGEILISSIEFPYPQGSALKNEGKDTGPVSRGLALSLGKTSSPPPAYATNPDLVTQKRLNHAMDEIRDLQNQVQALKSDLTGSSTSFRNELSGMKRTLSTVLRKEAMRTRSRPSGPEPPHLLRKSSLSESESGGETLDVLKEDPAEESATSDEKAAPADKDAETRGAQEKTSIVQWAALVASGHFFGPLVPGILLRVVLFGCLTEWIVRAASNYSSRSTQTLFPMWTSK